MGGLVLDEEQGALVFDREVYSPPACPLAPFAIPPRAQGRSQHGTHAFTGAHTGLGGHPSLSSSSATTAPPPATAANLTTAAGLGLGLGSESTRGSLRLCLDYKLAAHVILVMSQHRGGLTIPAAGLAVLR